MRLAHAPSWQRIVDAMTDVVHGPHGTARKIGTDLGYRIAGKTGTAQVIAIGQNEEYDAESIDKKFHDHGLFIAFAPLEQPQIAVSVIVENGGSGSGAAAPLARTVIDAWLGDSPAPVAPGERSLRTAQTGRTVPSLDSDPRVRTPAETTVDARVDFSERLHVDVPLLLGVLLLCTLGLMALYSAGGRETDLITRQAIRLAIGVGVMLVIAQIAPKHFFFWAPILYLASVLLLCAVLAFGETTQGAQRWLRVGPVGFQPSEFAKVTVPLMVAWFLSRAELPPRLWRIVLGGLLTLLPVALVMRQPDLGTSLLIVASGGFVLFLAGLGWRYIAVVFVSGAACVPVLWHFMHDYQRQRVLTLLDPQQDPLGAGYHIIQSTIAIGSGGMYGKGWFNGTQSQLDFLPERSTDFIFAVIGEEFGLLGILVLLSTYLFIVYRGLYIATQAQTTFGKLLIGALVLTFFIYVFVNIGMVSGILPVVGFRSRSSATAEPPW